MINRILFVMDSFCRGGAETLLLSTCKELLSRKIVNEIHVLTLLPNHTIRKEFIDIGITVHYIDIDSTPFLKRFVLVWRLTRKIRPDIVHSHLLLADRYGLPCAYFAGVKKRFSTNHNMEISRNFQDQITRKITNIFAKKIVSVSQTACDFAIKNKINPSNKLIVVPNAVSIDRNNFSPRIFHTETPFRLVAVGRLNQQKNQVEMIKMLSILNKRGIPVQLDIYGTGELEAELTKEISQIESPSKLCGLIENSSIPEMLQRATLFISSSLYEGLPLSVLEAMSTGTPMVISNIGPHLEVLDEEKTASSSIYELGNIQQFAEKVEALLTTPDLYNQAAELAYKRSAFFTLDRMLESYKKLYTMF